MRDAYEVSKAERGLVEVSKLTLPPAASAYLTRGKRYGQSLKRTYQSNSSMTDVNPAGQEIRIGSPMKGAREVGRQVFGTADTRDFATTATRMRRGTKRQAAMVDRTVGEARRLRNVGVGVGAAGGLAAGGTLAAFNKAKRLNLNDPASLAAMVEDQAKVVQAAEKNRAKVHARHDPIVAAAAAQPAKKPRAPRKKAVVPESVTLNPNPPKKRAPAKRNPTPRETADIYRNLSGPASRRQIGRGALIGAGIGAGVAGGAALYGIHRAKKRRAQLVPVGKARIPKPRVGSVVRTNYAGHSRNATVGMASNGRRKLTLQTPVVSAGTSGKPRSYNLQNFTTGPVWRAGGYAAANPGRTAAGAAGGAAALGASYWAGTRSS